MSSIESQNEQSAPCVIGHALSSEQTLLLLQNRLLPLLPYGITLTRWIQFYLNNPSPGAEAYLLITADEASTTNTDTDTSSAITTWLSTPSTSPPPATHPFVVAHIDLAPAGQTQVVLFASWEIPPSHTTPTPTSPSSFPSPPPNPILSPPSQPTTNENPLHATLIRALLSHILTTHIPRRPTSPPPEWLWLRDNKKYLSQPYSTTKVLFGAINRVLTPHFEVKGGVARRDGVYWKLILPAINNTNPHTLTENDKQAAGNGAADGVILPAGYTFNRLTETDLHTVVSRTPIPRTIRTLRSVTNLGIYYSNTTQHHQQQQECIAWAFLNKDGSLSSLHVEPAHRGKGLATALARRLVTMQNLRAMFKQGKGISESGTAADAADTSGGDGDRDMVFAHADVDPNNTPSQRVVSKLGGKVWWGVQWLEVDVAVLLESGN